MTRLFRALLFLLAIWMIGAFMVCIVGMRKARADIVLPGVFFTPEEHPCPQCPCGCYEHGCVTTLLSCGDPWYDKDGTYHIPEPENCNKTKCDYECKPCEKGTQE